MKFIDEFRQPALAEKVLHRISEAVLPGKTYRLMEFCGGHTHTLFRYGIPSLLPDNIQMLHGPGCPVCVLPISSINKAIALAELENTILCSYGDMLRVPGSQQKSLLKARAQGADIRMLYSPLEALSLAKENPDKRVIFFAVGFETTTPPTVAVLDAAIKANISNLFIFCNHVLTPPAITGILEPARQANKSILDGLIGPGHVSVVTGSEPYVALAKKYKVPITISGFEPLDILQSILLLIEQINAGHTTVENQYSRAVSYNGNPKAQDLMAKYLTLRESFEWRGLGFMANSALKIQARYKDYDAEEQFAAIFSKLEQDTSSADNKACECPAVLCGQKKPTQCKLFDNPCTPENPLGSCMVSSEGACAAYYRYRPHEQSKNQAH
jgi:hydrogenase expression/formation protein HypD